MIVPVLIVLLGLTVLLLLVRFVRKAGLRGVPQSAEDARKRQDLERARATRNAANPENEPRGSQESRGPTPSNPYRP